MYIYIYIYIYICDPFMYIYKHFLSNMKIHACKCECTGPHMCKHVDIHEWTKQKHITRTTYTCTNTDIVSHSHIHACAHINTHIHILNTCCAQTHACVHARIHVCIHAQHAYVNPCTYMQGIYVITKYACNLCNAHVHVRVHVCARAYACMFHVW
jgi:hypothetical protein